MKQDIRDKVELDFIDPEEVFRILEKVKTESGGLVPDRVFRSILFLSSGSKEKLNSFVDLAIQDVRDLYWQAEYRDPDVHLYDFNKSFVELGLL